MSMGRGKTLYITSHHVSGLCLTQLDIISLSQKVDLHSKIFSSIFIYSIVHVCGLTCILSLISEEIFLLIELHGIHKKLSVNDIKTKRYGNSNFLLEVF